MNHRSRLLLIVLALVAGGERLAAQSLPVGNGGFPNVTQTPGQLLSGLNAPRQGRTAILAYHGGVLFTVPELPSSQPNSDFAVRTWDISNPRSPVLLSTLGTSPMPVNAHGYFQSGEYLVLGGNFPPASPWSFRAMADGTLQRTQFPGLLGITDRGHLFAPWYVGPTYRIYMLSNAPAQIRLDGQVLGTWDHLGQTGVIGHPFLLGNLLIFAAEESRTGVATYDVSDPSNPVLLDVLRAGGAGGYWPELWAGGGRLYAVFPYRLDGNGLRVVDLTDPTDLRFIADRSLSGATAQYAQFQDEYAFIGDHKIDMRTFDSVLVLDSQHVIRPSDGGIGVDTSQFALPLGNLLVTGGIGPDQGMAIWAHQAEPDTRGPSVAYHIPRSGQTGYPVGAPISLMIHETLDSLTLVAGSTILVQPIGGAPIAGSVVAAFDDIITFTPDQPLQSDTTYEVVIPAGGIRDVVGNGAVAHRFTFSTGNALGGNVPPVVLSVSPSTHPTRPGNGVAISAVGEDPEGGALDYRFDFGDGSPLTPWAPAAAVTHVYAETGHYTVTAQVRDDAQLIATGTTRVTVVPALAAALPTNSSGILCDTARRRVWAVDRDNGALAGFDADTSARLHTVRVCRTPRSVARSAAGELWVACEGDDSLRILDEDTLSERARIDGGYGSAPVAVAASPDGNSIYAAYSGRREIVRYAASGAETGRTAVEAAPRALAVSGDGATLFATRLLSGPDEAQVWRLRTSPLQSTGTAAIGRFGGEQNADTPASGRGVANHLAGIALAPLDGTAWFAANKANTARGTLIAAETELGEDSTVRNLVVGLDATSLALRRAIDLDNSDSASAIAFSPLGDYALIALQGNDDILVLDALNLGAETGFGSIVGRFATGAAPQGLCVDPVTQRTFVQNFLGRSVTVLDTAALFSQGSLSFARNDVAMGAQESLAPDVLAGKRIFYFAGDPRMSAEGYMSCATCHLDGGSDGRTWDFTGRGEGLRNTVDLRGRGGVRHGNVHWSANFDEIQDFEGDIRNAFGGSGFLSDAEYALSADPLGAPKAGRSADLDALASYVGSLGDGTLPRSPHRAAGGAASAAGERGRQVYAQLGCVQCHGGSRLTDSGSGGELRLHDVGTLRTTSGDRLGGALAGIDTPTLRGLWLSAPYLHDGSAPRVTDVFGARGGQVIAAESGTLRGDATRPPATEINEDDTVRGRGYVGLSTVPAAANFAAVDFTNVAGGAGGAGSIELRYSASGADRVDVVVNGVRHPVNIVATGNVPSFRRTRWRSARAEGVALAAGAANTVSLEVTAAVGMGLGVDEITVATSAELARAQPHRAALGLSASQQDDLEAYLLELDGADLADALLRSGFEAGE